MLGAQVVANTTSSTAELVVFAAAASMAAVDSTRFLARWTHVRKKKLEATFRNIITAINGVSCRRRPTCGKRSDFSLCLAVICFRPMEHRVNHWGVLRFPGINGDTA